VRDVRESVKEVILLDAGDLLFKKFSAPIPENELRAATQKAELIINSFSLMGYDAVGIGDDDLSLGKDFLVEMSKKSKVPFLSSNVVNEETGKTLFHPFLLKEVNGLRVGIFSLLSPDLFLNPSDPRKKGLVIRPPVETAQTMVKELKSKTDLLILLSHLGYPKDMELAQVLSGIDVIVGGHTGINLSYPPLIKDTIVLQTASKGMYGGSLDLILNNHGSGFYNVVTKRSLENNRNNFKDRLNSPVASKAEKTQWRKTLDELERTLAQYQGKNEFSNTILPLNEQMKEHPDIG